MIFKLLATLLLLALSLSAQTAQEYYKVKEYEKALALVEVDYVGFSSIDTQLLWARSADKLGDDEAAMSAYERVLNLDENNIEAALFLAKVYKKQNLKKELDILIEKLKSYRLSGENKNALLLLLEDNPQRSTVRFDANVKIGYDSNVNANAGSGNLDDYYQDIGSNARASEDVIDSLFGAYGANMSYLYDMGGKSGWYLQSDINLYGQNFMDASPYDIYFAKASLGLGYKMQGTTLYLPLSYDHLYYLESNLVNALSLTPTMNTAFNENYLTSLRLIYKHRSYIQENLKNRDDSEMGLEASVFSIYNRSYIYSTLLADVFKADKRSNIKYLDKNLYAISVGVNYNFTRDYFMKINYQYRYSIYRDLIEIQEDKRADNHNNISIELSTIFLKNFETSVNYVHISNSSNYVPSTFSKDILSFGLNYNY